MDAAISTTVAPACAPGAIPAGCARGFRHAQRGRAVPLLGAAAADALLPAGRVHLLRDCAQHRRIGSSADQRRACTFPGTTRAAPRGTVLALPQPGARVPTDPGRALDRDLARRDPVYLLARRLDLESRLSMAVATLVLRLAEPDPRLTRRLRSDRVPARARIGLRGGRRARIALTPRTACRRRPRRVVDLRARSIHPDRPGAAPGGDRRRTR